MKISFALQAVTFASALLATACGRSVLDDGIGAAGHSGHGGNNQGGGGGTNVGGSGGAGGTGQGGFGGSAGCTADFECQDPNEPHCLVPPGECVQCINSSQCPAGDVCDTLNHTCVHGPGCNSDVDCTDASKPHCVVTEHTCVECTTDAQCPTGDLCQDNSCVGFCGPGGACGPNQTCCGPLCVNTSTNPKDCGGCGITCGPFAHANPGCDAAKCDIATCDAGFANCNGIVADGCEANTDNDPLHCGGCDIACKPGETCSGGTCAGMCGTGAACDPGQTCCGLNCKDLGNDVLNCGGCDKACPAPMNGTATCVTSQCAIASCGDGFADCNMKFDDGCEVRLATDTANCGGCGHACAAGETCSGGVCAGTCTPTGDCTTGLTCCGMQCANTVSDPNNCGMCSTVCPMIAHGQTSCANSACGISACDAGFADCNKKIADGCEIDTGTDSANCGGCGIACSSTQACQKGVCTDLPCSQVGCKGGLSCCNDVCLDTQNDPLHCGSCDVKCADASATCSNGMCQTMGCNGGPLCTGSQDCCATGCSNTKSDPANCGACGNACKMGESCVNSACKPLNSCNGGPACSTAETCCMTGCTDTKSDPLNCGGCATPCLPGQTCDNGACNTPMTCNGGPACATGKTCCMTGCLDTQNDPLNCGSCGNACPATQDCISGQCAKDEGAFNPTANPTYLSPGVHNFTTINIAAGITVYVAGSGANSGTLELHATGDVVIDGTIDLSGGPGTQNTITSHSTQEGRAGSGGFTGEPYESADLSSACKFVAGNGGQLGIGIVGTPGSCFVASTTACMGQGSQHALLFTAPVAQFGGGGGIFSGYRAYGSGGGGKAGGAPGALGAAYPGEDDCSGASGGGGAVNGKGGASGFPVYNGKDGILGQTQCPGVQPQVPKAYVGGGGGGGIGPDAANDLAVLMTFYTGSGGGGGSSDYLNRPVFGGTSGGGGGGGALRIASATKITIRGQVLANGGMGGDGFIGNGSNANCDPQPGAAGGGGSGGVIYLAAPSITTTNAAHISAAGGPGGEQSEFATGGGGGTGGLGRIRLSVTPGTCTLGGSFSPALQSGCTVSSGAGTRGRVFIGSYPN